MSERIVGGEEEHHLTAKTKVRKGVFLLRAGQKKNVEKEERL